VRKTDSHELNLFPTHEAFAQITQGKAEPKPGKRPARFNINLFGHILVMLVDVCAGDSHQEIHREFTLGPSTFQFFPKSIISESVLVVVEIARVPHTPRLRKNL
jgi:hypothetical protein